MWRFLLDLLLPQKARAYELLGMTGEEFAERARKSEGRVGKALITLFSYHDPLVKEAVWMLKYRGNRRIAALLAMPLYDEILAFLEEYAPLTNFTAPLLIPLPLSDARRRERGFNQCELLTDELARLDGGRNFSVSKTALMKIKDTPSQTKTDSRAERLKNLHGCFAADEKAVQGRNIIVIDDVATTGATVEEARRTLRRAGARRVIAFTAAH